MGGGSGPKDIWSEGSYLTGRTKKQLSTEAPGNDVHSEIMRWH